MRRHQATAVLAALLLGATLAGDAFAARGGGGGGFGGGHHWGGHAGSAAPRGWHWGSGHWSGGHWPRFHAGVFIGLPIVAPLFVDPWPYYYPDPYPVVVPAEPMPQMQWWYYCASAGQYYPYVQSCAEGWQKVPPQPPS